MKVFYRRVRNINVNGSLFYYIVNENKKDVKFRAYSSQYKTSFVEFTFSWIDNWNINLYKPSTAAKIIKYALENSWNPAKEKQIVKVTYDSSWHMF